MHFTIAWWDEHAQCSRLLQDPLTGRPAVFDTELAIGLVAYMARTAGITSGLMAAPDGPNVPVTVAFQAVALVDLTLAGMALAAGSGRP